MAPENRSVFGGVDARKWGGVADWLALLIDRPQVEVYPHLTSEMRCPVRSTRSIRRAVEHILCASAS